MVRDQSTSAFVLMITLPYFECGVSPNSVTANVNNKRSWMVIRISFAFAAPVLVIFYNELRIVLSDDSSTMTSVAALGR